MGQLRPGSPRPSQGRAAERGARDPSARAPAQWSPVPRLQGRASRWVWGCGGRWGWSAGRRAGSGQRVRLGRRLALRPSIGRNQLCRSLWLTSSSLLRRAAAIGRATPTSASSAGGFFIKGRLTEACGGSRLQGLPKPPWLGQSPQPPTSTSHTALARSAVCTWGEAPRENHAGACAPPGCCAPQCVLLCACTCLHVSARDCRSVGASVSPQVCAPKCTVSAAPLPACAPGFGDTGCGSHALTAVANQAQRGRAQQCTRAPASLQGPASEPLWTACALVGDPPTSA